MPLHHPKEKGKGKRKRNPYKVRKIKIVSVQSIS